MRRFMVAVMLVLMVTGSPVLAGDGDTPGDPIKVGVDGKYTFVTYECESSEPNDITYTLYEVYAAGDSVAVWSEPNVTTLVPGREYEYQGTLQQVVDGALVRLTVWMPDATNGRTDHCTKWVVVDKHTGGGCACFAGWN